MFGNQLLPELNLSLDPEAAYNVLSAGCPITLMNAHICLDAPFGMEDMSRVRSWDEEIQEKVIAHLKDLEGTVGVARDYLWDVLPVVYISYPDLFDENYIGMKSTVKDLQKGMIVAGEVRLPSINMPKKIQDIKRFKQIVFAAWEKTFRRANS
jgi:inosine-uridine nucleoside N-ribohydrolase